jgi:hypothetical protein
MGPGGADPDQHKDDEIGWLVVSNSSTQKDLYLTSSKTYNCFYLLGVLP